MEPNMPNMQTVRWGTALALCASYLLIGTETVHADVVKYPMYDKDNGWTLVAPYPTSMVGSHISERRSLLGMSCYPRESEADEDLSWRLEGTTRGSFEYEINGEGYPITVMSKTESMTEDTCTGTSDLYGPNIPAGATITAMSLQLTASMTVTNRSDKELRVAPSYTLYTVYANHGIEIDVNFVVKPKTSCRLDLPPVAVVPPVSLSQLQQTAQGNTLGEAVSPYVRVSCTGGGSARVRLVPGRVENGCMGTDLSGVTVCIDNTTLLPGGTTISPHGDGSIKLPLRPGRGTGDATAGSYRATLTAVLEQN